MLVGRWPDVFLVWKLVADEAPEPVCVETGFALKRG